MYIRHKTLTIRNAGTADCAQLAAWWNDGTIMAHAGFPLGLGTTPEKIAAQLETDRDDTRRRLVVERDGRLIGEMSYQNCGDGIAEIGIKICDATEQNRGQGKLLLSMLIDALFTAGYTQIMLDTNLRNTRAQHVYEQIGFTRVGVRVDSWTDQLGTLQSAVDYILQPEQFVSFLR